MPSILSALSVTTASAAAELRASAIGWIASLVLLAGACAPDARPAAAAASGGSNASPAADAPAATEASPAVRDASPASSRLVMEPPTSAATTAVARRVVPANTAAAEFVCALLGADRIAALPEQVDAYSVRSFKEAGLDAVPRFARYETETLLVHAPDLVVTHEWQSAQTTELLRARGTRVVVLRSARDYADVRGILSELGRIFAVEARAAEVTAGLDRRVEKLAAGAARRSAWRALLYTNDGTGGWTAGVDTTGDALLRLTGLVSVGREAHLKGHVGLDFERLVTLDPDLIVTSRPARDERGSATEATLRSVPALRTMKAIANDRIATLSSALFSSDSLSLVDAAEALAAQVDAWLAAESGGAPR